MSDHGNTATDDALGDQFMTTFDDAFRPTNDAIIAVGAMVSKIYLTLRNMEELQAGGPMDSYLEPLSVAAAAMRAALKEITSGASTNVEPSTNV